MDSILDHVKKLLGVMPEYDYFDEDIKAHINSAFFMLNQMGVGPEKPFTIEDSSAVWSDFLPDGTMELVKTYIPLKVKLTFDPPSNSFLVDNLRKETEKYEYLLMVEAEKNLLPPPDMSGIYRAEGKIVMNDFRTYVGKDYSSYLMHYGVSKRDGAKVGSGRYPLGSGKNPKQEKTTVKFKKTGIKEADDAIDVLNTYNILPDPKWVKDFKPNKREKAAADLGLKALYKFDPDMAEMPIDSQYDWFFFEDQTFGYTQIADLILQGKDKNEVWSVLRDADNAVNGLYDNPEAEKAFMQRCGDQNYTALWKMEVGSSYYPYDFIEYCVDEYSKQKPKSVFVSGSSKTTDSESGYYRKNLPKSISDELDRHTKEGNRILVGDAPGIDRQVQDYLNEKKYKNVEVYGPGKEVRYSANKKWKTNPIDAPEFEVGSKEWLAKKDIAMTEAADEGIAVILDEGAKATRKNIKRLMDSGKKVSVYELNKASEDLDHWLDENGVKTVVELLEDKRRQ